MKLEDLLNRDKSCGLRVINRRADLSRDILSIESSETPDVSRYIMENSFLITTAMIYKDNQKALCHLIRELNDKNCAGLGIKLGRFIDSLADEVVDLADELGFPLILIPLHKTLGDIYHKLLWLLWNKESDDLLEATNIKRKWYDMVANGAGLERMMQTASKFLQKQLLLMDSFGRTIVKNAVAKGLRQHIKEYIVQNQENLHRYKTKWEMSALEVPLLIYPIRTLSGSGHYLIVLNNEGGQISDYIMEEFVFLLRMLIYTGIRTVFTEMKRRSELFEDLTGNASEEQRRKILERCSNTALQDSPDYEIIVGSFPDYVNIRFDENRFLAKEEKYILCFEHLCFILNKKFQGKVFLFPNIKQWHFIILYQNFSEDINSVLEEAATMFKNLYRERLVFIVGERIAKLTAISRVYEKLKEKIYFSGEDRYTEGLLVYRPISVLDLLGRISKEQSRLVCKEILKNLAYPSDAAESELRNTLKTYLECRGSLMDTADKLFLHRNTIRYRIKKCEQILGRSLQDANTCFELQLALILSDR